MSNDTNVADRRQGQRHRTPDKHGIVSARVRPGYAVSLIDVSAGGALLETAHRLLPGSSIELHLATLERCAAVRGCVLRCAVVRLRASSVSYRGAIGFDRRLQWFAGEGGGYAIPGAEPPIQRVGRGGATPDVL